MEPSTDSDSCGDIGSGRLDHGMHQFERAARNLSIGPSQNLRAGPRRMARRLVLA